MGCCTNNAESQRILQFQTIKSPQKMEEKPQNKGEKQNIHQSQFSQLKQHKNSINRTSKLKDTQSTNHKEKSKKNNQYIFSSMFDDDKQSDCCVQIEEELSSVHDKSKKKGKQFFDYMSEKESEIFIDVEFQ